VIFSLVVILKERGLAAVLPAERVLPYEGVLPEWPGLRAAWQQQMQLE